MRADRWVVLDVGETLIDETRVWSTWADLVGIPRLTFLAGLGAAIARGADYGGVFDLFGIDDWRARLPELEGRYGSFRPEDLYPDALPAIDALRERGLRVAITANQPAVRAPELEALGIEVEVMAMSEAMGVSKPDPAFFARTLELLGDPAAARVAYVGDRVNNDVLPARRAGLRPVWLRRGPWAVIQPLPPATTGVVVVGSLTELVERIDEAWAPDP